jgi:hypothetical protein
MAGRPSLRRCECCPGNPFAKPSANGHYLRTAAGNCHSAWGPTADRRGNSLNCLRRGQTLKPIHSYVCPDGKELRKYHRSFSKPRDGVTKEATMIYLARKHDCALRCDKFH